MRKIKTIPKADARLNLLINKSILVLERMKKKENEIIVAVNEEIKKLYEPQSYEKNEKKKTSLMPAIRAKLESLPTPITFGLYFPKHNPKRIGSVCKIREPFISALIKAQATVSDLKKYGVQVRNRSGNIFTCFIPFSKISKLLSLKGVEFIELSRPQRNNLGSAIPYAQINTLHAAPGNLTGANVIVGIVDTPLDIYHPDFRNNNGAGGDGNGSSRVLFLWDQNLTRTGAEINPPVDPVLPGFSYAGGTAYGVEYSQANINNELNNYAPATPNAYTIVRHVPQTSEHGTHVAGCAAGNGRSGSVGAAPGADIIHVRLRGNIDVQADYIHVDNTFFLDAFSYVFARASLLGRPCIANRSGSDNMGPHDGKTLGEQFLDNLLLTTNRVITVAAGNTNTQTETILGNVPAAGTSIITINYINAASNDEFEIWYDGHDRFDFSVAIPDTPAKTLAAVAGATASVTLSNGIIVTVVSQLNDARNGDNRITMFIENVSAANRIPNGNWVITLTGATVINGSFSAWLERNNRGARTLVSATVNNMSIATPASGLRVIAVGSHADTATPPGIATSSSCGPSRDGRIKPDISTVGVNVTSSNSRNMNVLPLPGLTVSMGGTSMASPIIAGTCALLYECRGAGLSWFDIKQILQNNVAAPAVGIPSNQFGFGYLQIAGGCTPFVNDVDVWLRDNTDDTGVEPYPGSVTWRSPDIEVLDMIGNPVSNPTHNPANFVNNIIRVTARNRSALQVARNVEVYLYWADPGTAIAFPADWKSDGIYTGVAPNFINQSNKIVIPQIAAGGSVSVDFAWAPPAPGSNVRGDDHFCLLVRLENEVDASSIGTGGWGIIRGSNNIALRNTHIVAVAPNGDADSAFYVTGTEDADNLEITAENIDTPIIFQFPVSILPWYDLALAEKFGIRKPYGSACADKDPLREFRATLKSVTIAEKTGIRGADQLTIRNAVASLKFRLAKEGKIILPYINIAAGAKAAVRVTIKNVKSVDKARLHIGQLSGGVKQTGITIELVKQLQKSKVKSVLFDGKKLNILE